MTSRINSTFIILLAVSFAGPAFAQGPGADVYKAATPKCAMCHGADGLGNTPAGKNMKAASFKDPSIVKAPDAQLIASVKNGKGKMIPEGPRAKDDDIWNLVIYVRAFAKK